MEHTIGDLSQEVRQPSNPFANLAQQALCCAQVNALKIMILEVDVDQGYKVPLGAIDMNNGFVLLRPWESGMHMGLNIEQNLLQQQFGISKVQHWGQL